MWIYQKKRKIAKIVTEFGYFSDIWSCYVFAMRYFRCHHSSLGPTLLVRLYQRLGSRELCFAHLQK